MGDTRQQLPFFSFPFFWEILDAFLLFDSETLAALERVLASASCWAISRWVEARRLAVARACTCSKLATSDWKKIKTKSKSYNLISALEEKRF